MRSITEIIIHCSDTPDGQRFYAKDIDSWHRKRGFDGIGYHFVVPVDGRLEQGRRVGRIGAHAKPWNRNSIGICMIGRDRFSLPAWDCLRTLVVGLHSVYPKARIMGHRDVPGVAKTCPNFDVAAWVSLGFQPETNQIWVGDVYI